HRGTATDEQLRVFDAVWSADVAGFSGRFYNFEPVGVHPHPVQKPRPPVWIGGHTRAALRRVALHGDGWLPIGGRPPADLPPAEGGVRSVPTTLRRRGAPSDRRTRQRLIATGRLPRQPRWPLAIGPPGLCRIRGPVPPRHGRRG